MDKVLMKETFRVMEENDITKFEGMNTLQPPISSSVSVAINGTKTSKYVVQWALEKFVPEGEISFKLLHVCPKIIAVPTPMGNLIPIEKVRDDVVAAFRKEMHWKTREKLLPYKTMCTQRKVQVELVQIESDDVVNAIEGEVAKSNVTKLVIGASSRNFFIRGPSLSSRIAKCCPKFCTVYAVSKGKLSSVRPSASETNRSITNDSTETSCSSSNFSSYTLSSRGEWTDQSSKPASSQVRSPSLPMQRFLALSNMNQILFHKRTNTSEIIDCRSSLPDIGRGNDDDASSSSYINDANDGVSSSRSLIEDTHLLTTSQASNSDATPYFSCGSKVNVNFELEKLRIELRHLRGMYALAQSEAIDASRKLKDLEKGRLEEEIKLKEISLKEEEAKLLVEQEKEKYEAAKREADYVKHCAEREAALRKDAEAEAFHEAKEKEKLEDALAGCSHQYQIFTWEEIVSATSSFSEHLKIGMGGYGTVYKCVLRHITAAVKVLHSTAAHTTKQFRQELEVLSKIHHPHLLILLGACPDHGCLVYEYMGNGSLEERLFRRNNSPPLPWFERFRIAWEVASALSFLHSSKPEPIIHRDMKPANILLDHNLVSKIGDVGLSTMLHSDSSESTTYRDTGPVGTLCYIDPEYQRTGLISPKSDVYAFGIVIFQLLTAKPALALAHTVEKAIDEDRLINILDQEAGKWPIEETKELGILALKCTELRRRDRPDLKDQLLLTLERLKEVGDTARNQVLATGPRPPNHFICPILKEVMHDPFVAADGYTYEWNAIEAWLQENDKSPVTNLPMPHKNLLPNYTLLSAIMEWRSQITGHNFISDS